MKFFKNFLLLFLLSFTTIAQVQFEAKVSKNKLGLNERLRVDFEMNENGDNFVPPSFSNFNVVGGPSQSVSNSWVNGVRSFSKTYSYYLTPKSKGTFTIQQAKIEIDDEVYKTSPVKVVVTDAIEIPKNPNDPNYIASKNIHLVAEVSKSSPYLNEAVTVVYKLYVSDTVSVSNWQELSTPRYNDFWSQNIDVKGVNVERGMYKGESYRYVVLRKVVLFPQKSGKLELEPLSLDVSIDVPTNRRDFFGSRIMTQVHRTISAGKRVLNVKALPQNKPAGFTGAVGDFKFDVSISKEELNASESLTARVNVSGKGNLKLFSLPKLKLPSSLEVYEPEHSERVSVSLSGMTGKIEDSYTIIPQYQGKYPINDFHFSYFNPKTEKYVTLNSKDLLIRVNNGPVNSGAVASLNSTDSTNQVVQKQQISSSSNQFKFIKTTTNLVPVGSDYLFGTKLFWSLILIPLVLLLIVLIFDKILQKRNSDVTGLKVRTANRLVKKYLSEAKKNSSDKELFYESLERAIFNFLKAKLQIEQTEYNRDQLSEMLIGKSIEEDVVKDLLSILETCNFARFTPSTPDSINKDYQKAEDVLSKITNSI